MDITFPATEMDAALISNADDNRTQPDSAVVSADWTVVGQANFRSQFRIIDGHLYRVLVA